MIQPQYAIAKYISELQRNEPRNMGVILWTRWGVFAKFVGEGPDGFDSRRLPSWVVSKKAFKEWVLFWRKTVDRKECKTRSGIVVKASEPGFLEALKGTGKANYILSDMGIVMETIAQEDVPGLLEFLFNTLVREDVPKDEARKAFDVEKECNSVIRKTGISKSELFHRNKGVLCNISPDVTEFFEFDYYLGNGTPEHLYQRVALGGHVDKSIHAAAWQFERVIHANIIPAEKSAAVVMSSEDQRRTSDYKRAISVLGTQTRVFDLGVTEDREKFENELQSAKESLVPHHS